MLYVSAVEGFAVSRFGSATRSSPNQTIGGRRTTEKVLVAGHKLTNRPIEIDTNVIVVIPDAEHARFRREYDRAIKDGTLKLRSEEDYKSFIAARTPTP